MSDLVKTIEGHIADREAINKELTQIMGYVDDSTIEFDLSIRWSIFADELHIAIDDKTDLEDDYYGYTISSYGAKGEQFFMGEKDGFTYVMAHDDNSWKNTIIFVLNNKNKVE